MQCFVRRRLPGLKNSSVVQLECCHVESGGLKPHEKNKSYNLLHAITFTFKKNIYIYTVDVSLSFWIKMKTLSFSSKTFWSVVTSWSLHVTSHCSFLNLDRSCHSHPWISLMWRHLLWNCPFHQWLSAFETSFATVDQQTFEHRGREGLKVASQWQLWWSKCFPGWTQLRLAMILLRSFKVITI